MGTEWRDTPLSNYQIHNIARNEDGYNYYLYIHADGRAIIMRELLDETEYLYSRAGFGDSKWDVRDTLDYVTYDKLAR